MFDHTPSHNHFCLSFPISFSATNNFYSKFIFVFICPYVIIISVSFLVLMKLIKLMKYINFCEK